MRDTTMRLPIPPPGNPASDRPGLRAIRPARTPPHAGVMALPQLTRTPAGYEVQFATNHLGHFALTSGLHKWLPAANGTRDDARR